MRFLRRLAAAQIKKQFFILAMSQQTVDK